MPVNHFIKPAVFLSICLSGLVVWTATFSIFNSTTVYPLIDIRTGFVATDWGNLLIALPLLVIFLVLTLQGRACGLLLWPGAILYILYGYIPYLFRVPFGPTFPAYLLIIPLSFYTIVYLIANIDNAAISRYYSKAPVKLIGGALLVLAGFNISRLSGLIGTALAAGTTLDSTEQIQGLADFIVIIPAMLISGVLIWRRRPLGYASAPALLLVYVALVAGLIPVVIAQARWAGLAFPTVDIIVLTLMALICLVPLILFFHKPQMHLEEK